MRAALPGPPGGFANRAAEFCLGVEIGKIHKLVFCRLLLISRVVYLNLDIEIGSHICKAYAFGRFRLSNSSAATPIQASTLNVFSILYIHSSKQIKQLITSKETVRRRMPRQRRPECSRCSTRTGTGT